MNEALTKITYFIIWHNPDDMYGSWTAKDAFEGIAEIFNINPKELIELLDIDCNTPMYREYNK